MSIPNWVTEAWLRAALRIEGFWCERCKHFYRDDNQCPRHGR